MSKINTSVINDSQSIFKEEDVASELKTQSNKPVSSQQDASFNKEFAETNGLKIKAQSIGNYILGNSLMFLLKYPTRRKDTW